MACESWTEKLDAYFDGELTADDARALQEHLRGCSSCAADGLARLQQKLAVRAAGQRFTPDPAFRARIEKSIAARKPSPWRRYWLPALAAAAVLLMVSAFLLTLNRERRGEQQLIGELADLHVATLASANPVDVVSTDRHTVKPWFAGRIPFTFNLPDLQESPFTLVGGKVSYLHQSPGAELIYRVRQHQISVFIFQEKDLRNVSGAESALNSLSFQVRSWTHNGLRYFVIGDANAQDIDKLTELLKSAG
jgi:anti-sigma factor RsiW